MYVMSMLFSRTGLAARQCRGDPVRDAERRLHFCQKPGAGCGRPPTGFSRGRSPFARDLCSRTTGDARGQGRPRICRSSSGGYARGLPGTAAAGPSRLPARPDSDEDADGGWEPGSLFVSDVAPTETGRAICPRFAAATGGRHQSQDEARGITQEHFPRRPTVDRAESSPGSTGHGAAPQKSTSWECKKRPSHFLASCPACAVFPCDTGSESGLFVCSDRKRRPLVRAVSDSPGRGEADRLDARD